MIPRRLRGAALALASAGLVGAVAGSLASGLAFAQDAPESLLPPGFDDPEPAPSPSPSPTPSQSPSAAPAPARTGASERGTPASSPSATGSSSAPSSSAPPEVPAIPSSDLGNLPSLEELENLSANELDDRLGLKPTYDIPPAAQRSLERVGLLAAQETGFASRGLANQPADLVRAILSGTKGPLVSRWGHILMRRALASRLAAPEGMDPVEFAALRVGVLNRMGEFIAARALAQDVDTGNWNSALATAALDAFIASSDPIGACPYVRLQRTDRENARWVMLNAICNAYAGEVALAGSQLDRALNQEIAPDIDVLLARRFAGAAGSARQGVVIEWDAIEELNPWRFSLANAVGETVPVGLLDEAAPYYSRAGALSATVPLAQRVDFAQRAANEGVLSANALIDMYSVIYAGEGFEGEPLERAQLLRAAYVAQSVDDRISAMSSLWSDGGGSGNDLGSGESAYWSKVLTAYAAARIVPSSAHADVAGDLIASMLTAGLDRDARAWRSIVEPGSEGWALIALSDPQAASISSSALDEYVDRNEGGRERRAAFLVAGLAGLGRIDAGEANDYEDRLSLGLDRRSRWAQTIGRAADLENAVLVAMLAGLGMQGTDWSQMTPLHLYHITRSLSAVGLEAEARMIAAEALARS